MKLKTENKTILITVLNWGLGHATRCIPIIKTLESNDFTPIIASDGQALQLLKKEFPYILCLELPSYDMQYPKNGKHFKRKLIQNLPKMAVTIWKEKKTISNWIEQYNIKGIISDNRMGCYSKKIPSVYITHQLNVLTGSTTWFSTKLHQIIIKNFNECWIPDLATEPNLAGKLSHISNNNNLKLVYIGPQSRLQPMKTEKHHDLMIILSGPEPQREILEKHLVVELKKYEGKVIFIKGKIEANQKKERIDNITYYNFIRTLELQQLIQESEIVLCRSGYTSIMDLAKLNKKAFFIPTPGQYEQIYLAEKLQKEGLAPYSSQETFKIEDLANSNNFKGLSNLDADINWEKLFNLFSK